MARADGLRGEQKTVSREVARATAEDRPAVLARARHLADEVKAAEADQAEADQALRTAHLAIPNVVEDGVAPGGEDDFVTLETVGTPPVGREHRATTPRSGRRCGPSTPSAARRSAAPASTSSPASAPSSNSPW